LFENYLDYFSFSVLQADKEAQESLNISQKIKEALPASIEIKDVVV
jgi:hypothetical protein